MTIAPIPVAVESETIPAVAIAAESVRYEFGPGADFEGRRVGALERLEATGESRVLDGLFVASDPDTGRAGRV